MAKPRKLLLMVFFVVVVVFLPFSSHASLVFN